MLTHRVLLKPALQAFVASLGVSRPGAYAPGSIEIGPSGLRGTFGASCRLRGSCFGGSAYLLLRFRPEGSVSGSPVHEDLKSWVMTSLGGRGSCRAEDFWKRVSELVLGSPGRSEEVPGWAWASRQTKPTGHGSATLRRYLNCKRRAGHENEFLRAAACFVFSGRNSCACLKIPMFSGVWVQLG